MPEKSQTASIHEKLVILHNTTGSPQTKLGVPSVPSRRIHVVFEQLNNNQALNKLINFYFKSCFRIGMQIQKLSRTTNKSTTLIYDKKQIDKILCNHHTGFMLPRKIDKISVIHDNKV